MTDFKPTADYEVYRGDFSFCTGLSWVEVDKQIKFEKEQCTFHSNTINFAKIADFWYGEMGKMG